MCGSAIAFSVRESPQGAAIKEPLSDWLTKSSLFQSTADNLSLTCGAIFYLTEFGLDGATRQSSGIKRRVTIVT